MAVTAFDNAAVWFERAHNLSDDLDPQTRLAVLRGLGRALALTGRPGPAMEVWIEAVECARMVGRVAFAEAVIGYEDASRRQMAVAGNDIAGGLNRLIELSDEAITNLSGCRPDLSARILAPLARAITFVHHPGGGLHLARSAVEVARTCDDHDVQIMALESLRRALGNVDDHAARCAVVQEISDLNARSDLLSVSLLASTARVAHGVEVLDRGIVRDAVRQYGEAAERSGQPIYRAMAARAQAMDALLSGDLDAAEDLVSRAMALAQEAQSPGEIAVVAGQLIQLRREQGRAAEAEPLARAAWRQSAGYVPWTVALPSVLSDLGSAIAVAEVHNFCRRLKTATRDANYLFCIAAMSEAAYTLQDPTYAEWLSGEMQPHARQGIHLAWGTIALGSAHRTLGQCAALLGRWDEAARHFQTARERNGPRGLDSPMLVAHVLLDEAKMLLRRQPADIAGCRAAIEQALELTARLPAVAIENTARNLLASMDALREQNPLGLTPREADVLSHIASGRSNKEIAARLVVSIRTVEGHLQNIYPKLGVRSRTEAAAFAIAHRELWERLH